MLPTPLQDLLDSAGERTLILTTDELRSPERIRELFDHLRLAGKQPPAPPPPRPTRTASC